MDKKIKLQETNKKHNAFKRFAQMGVAAALTVRLVPVFTDVSVPQATSNFENDAVKKQNSELVNMQADNSSVIDNKLLAYVNNCYSDYSNYGNYSNYANYSNYSDYWNYSNYNDYSNYSNYVNCQ